MGWLEVNKTKLEVKAAKRRRKIKIESTPPPEKKLRLCTTLESLPKELLEKIFIYSGNIDLVFCSKQLMAKLSPHFYLESQIILAQLVDGVAPTSVLLLPFTTVSLLKYLGIDQFDPMKIPDSILTGGDPELIIYLLGCGLATQEHGICYDRFLNFPDNKGLKLLLKKEFVPTTENLLKALQMGNKYAHRMVAMAKLEREGVELVWREASKLGKKRVLEELRLLL